MKQTSFPIRGAWSAVMLILAVTSCWNAALGSGLLGVYYGTEGWSMGDVAAMEAWQGKKNAVLTLFTGWMKTYYGDVLLNLFHTQLPNIWSNGNVPHITWEPFTVYQSGSGLGAPPDIEVRIANGEYDGYIHEWANRLKIWLSGPDGVFGTGDDRRAYIRLGHEMNGFWYPWGVTDGDNHPSDFVCMWTRIHGIFAGKGLGPSHIQWIWCVNHMDAEDCGYPTGFPAESFYPGAAYADWIGIDGYNWGTSQGWSQWQTADEVFADMLSRLRSMDGTRPIALTEFASTSAGGNKGNWITDTFNYIISNDIRLTSWFNENKETDWSVYGYGINYSQYVTAVGNPWFIPSNPSNPRLLTDEQFAGNL